jgi:hypothetical protein
MGSIEIEVLDLGLRVRTSLLRAHEANSNPSQNGIVWGRLEADESTALYSGISHGHTRRMLRSSPEEDIH